MRTNLPETHERAARAARNALKQPPEAHTPGSDRSGRHLGAAKCVDQTFLKMLAGRRKGVFTDFATRPKIDLFIDIAGKLLERVARKRLFSGN